MLYGTADTQKTQSLRQQLQLNSITFAYPRLAQRPLHGTYSADYFSLRKSEPIGDKQRNLSKLYCPSYRKTFPSRSVAS